MKLKNDKGVTLLVLTITIIVLLIITSITIYNSKNQLAIKNVNNLYSDIESIGAKVTDYYLKNNALPVFENAYLNSRDDLDVLLKRNGATENVINPNDDGAYYVINLSKLENLTLNYGRDYKNWSDDSSFQNYQDLYIINAVTHQIYYPLGIKLNSTVYFSRNIDTKEVDKIENQEISNEGFKLTSIQQNKIEASDENKVIIVADITLEVSPDFQKNTLQYGWKVSSDESDIIFTEFSLDDLNSVALTSKLLDDSQNYDLYIKVLDNNGDEHTLTYGVEFL